MTYRVGNGAASKTHWLDVVIAGSVIAIMSVFIGMWFYMI